MRQSSVIALFRMAMNPLFPSEVLIAVKQYTNNGTDEHPRLSRAQEGKTPPCQAQLTVVVTESWEEVFEGRSGYMYVLMVECNTCRYRRGPLTAFTPRLE